MLGRLMRLWRSCRKQGEEFLELTEQERDIIAGVRKEKGHIMQANLKAKARMYSLKKLEKGKSL